MSGEWPEVKLWRSEAADKQPEVMRNPHDTGETETYLPAERVVADLAEKREALEIVGGAAKAEYHRRREAESQLSALRGVLWTAQQKGPAVQAEAIACALQILSQLDQPEQPEAGTRCRSGLRSRT